MRRRLPPLNTLRLFEESARFGSVKDAAKQLRLTPSAISHGVIALEEWLGLPLFERTVRGLVLAKAGQEYLPVITRALDSLSTASDHISGRYPDDLLTISAAPTIASRWLLPRLLTFRERYPSLRIKIDTSHFKVDLSEGEVDVAIRLGKEEASGLVSDFIFREQLQPVCSPSSIYRFCNLLDIDEAPLLHVITASAEWTAWAKHALRAPPDRSKGLYFDAIYMAFEAAAQGLGVALGR